MFHIVHLVHFPNWCVRFWQREKTGFSADNIVERTPYWVPAFIRLASAIGTLHLLGSCALHTVHDITWSAREQQQIFCCLTTDWYQLILCKQKNYTSPEFSMEACWWFWLRRTVRFRRCRYFKNLIPWPKKYSSERGRLRVERIEDGCRK